MPYPRLAATGRFFGRLWSVVDGTRRLLLNLLFLLLLVILAVAVLRGGAAPLSDKTTLVLNLRGKLVEQRSVTAREAALAQVGAGRVSVDTQLRDVRTVLDAAAKDPRCWCGTTSAGPACRRCTRRRLPSHGSAPRARR
jgi:protease-4